MSERTFRDLMKEYRPSMQADVLHAWAADVVAAWQGNAPERIGTGDLEDRMFYNGFGFCIAHIARDMGDNHAATMFATQNGFGLSDFLNVGLDPYDLNPLLEAFAPTKFDELWLPIEEWDREEKVIVGYREDSDSWVWRYTDGLDAEVSVDIPMCIEGIAATTSSVPSTLER